jgi:hypothetical protein
MGTTVGWGSSNFKDPRKAGQESARSAMEKLELGTCHSCIVFSTVGYDPRILLDAIKAEVGPVPMVGCSGAGCIARGIVDESNHCVVVVAIADNGIRMNTAGLPHLRDSTAAGHAIGRDLKKNMGQDARCVLLLPCGLNALADELIPAMEACLGKKLPLIGGLAADNLLRVKTYQYHDWQIYEGGVSAALLSGDFFLATDVTHGCMPIGTEKEITKVDGNRIYEIDHRPVLDVMVDYVGEELRADFGKLSLHFCIAQKTDAFLSECYDPFIIRYIVQYHSEDGSISLPVKFKKGDKIWMSRRDQQRMFLSSGKSIENLKRAVGDHSVLLAFYIDCVGRGKLVLSEHDQMSLIGTVQEGVAADCPWAGLFSYGEFCPVGERNVFHNYTAVLALLCR